MSDYGEKLQRYGHGEDPDLWICLDCRKETLFYELSSAMCCACGSGNTWTRSAVIGQEQKQRIAELEADLEQAVKCIKEQDKKIAELNELIDGLEVVIRHQEAILEDQDLRPDL